MIEWAPSEMNHLQFSRMRVGRTGRVLLALWLIAGFISAVAPIASVSAGNTCTLSCCAGRAPHAAGSCMDGSCHAVLSRRSQSTHQHNQTYDEHFCGLARLKQFSRSLFSSRAQASVRGKSPTGEKESNAASLSGGTIGRPCDPNCGDAVFSSSTQSKPRHAATIAHADKPRPPSALLQSRYSLTRHKTHTGFNQKVSPRGPPLQYS